MSNPHTIPQTEWRTFFDRMSAALLGQRAEIEVASPDLGDQIIVEWAPMLGITYEAHDDVLDVALDRSNHMIRHPRTILVDETATGLSSIAVTDGEGARQIVRFKEPLMLTSGS
jgi:hypothetical protein